MTHPFTTRYGTGAPPGHTISGHLVWTEDENDIGFCGSETTVSLASNGIDELRPVQVITLTDLGGMGVTLELSPDAALALAQRLAQHANEALAKEV